MQASWNGIAIYDHETLSTLHHDVENYALFYVRSGECTLSGDGFVLSIAEKEAFLLQCNTPYHIEGNCSAVEIRFSKELFFRYCLPVTEGSVILNSFFVRSAEKNTVLYLHFRRLSDEIPAAITSMRAESEAQHEGYLFLLICQLGELLLRLSRNFRMNAAITEAPNSHLIQKILDCMMRNFRTVTLDDLAKQFNYHPNSIAAILKRETGKTFSDLLLQIRMSHAAQLLSQPDISVRDVAEASGYNNMSNFYTRFRAYYGMTPTEYVRSLRR